MWLGLPFVLDLESAKAKLGWADDHMWELRTEVREWGENDSDPVIEDMWEDHPDQRYTIIRAKLLKPISRAWPFAVGDIVSNYRAALNYAARALVQAGSAPGRAQGTAFQFPIVDPGRKPRPNARTFLDPGDWARKKCLPGVPRKYVRTLSPFQPYPSRLKARWPLDLLRDLSNRDKHQETLLAIHGIEVIHAIAEIRLDRSNEPVRPVQSFVGIPLRGWSTPQAGTKLMRLEWQPGFQPVRSAALRAGISEDPKVGVNFQIPVGIALKDYGARDAIAALEEISGVLWKIFGGLGRV